MGQLIAGSLFTLDAQGNIIANIVPRSGTHAALLAIAGGVGELASATDKDAIVKYSGVVGGAETFYPYASSKAMVAVGLNHALAPDADFLSVTSGGANIFLLSAGYFTGQIITIAFPTGGAINYVALAGATSISGSPGQAVVLRWTGAEWYLVDVIYIGADDGIGAVKIGVGASAALASAAGSVQIGGGATAAAGGIAIGNLTATINERSVALGNSMFDLFPGDFVFGSNFKGSLIHTRNTLYYTTLAAGAQKLTFDDLAPALTNQMSANYLGGLSGQLIIEATFFAKDMGLLTYSMFRRTGVFKVDVGVITQIGATETVGVDSNGIAGLVTLPIFQINDAGTTLDLTVTGIAAKTIAWTAATEMTFNAE